MVVIIHFYFPAKAQEWRFEMSCKESVSQFRRLEIIEELSPTNGVAMISEDDRKTFSIIVGKSKK
jgi:hypothetical protein